MISEQTAANQVLVRLDSQLHNEWIIWHTEDLEGLLCAFLRLETMSGFAETFIDIQREFGYAIDDNDSQLCGGVK